MSAGKGQRSNTWSSPEGNCYVTYLFALDNSKSIYTVFIATLAVLETLPIPAKIKWINDLFVNDKKIAGILTKGQTTGQKCVISLGVGVNLNIKPDLDIATCVKQESG